MDSTNKKKIINQPKRSTLKPSDLQKLYYERMERFMALVELSYALKTAPRIVYKK